MTLGPKHTIAFDLDGTLVDTAPDLCRALNFVLDQRGLPLVEEKLVRADVGFGAAPEVEKTVLVAAEQVVGVKPAIGETFAGQLGPIVIAGENGG